MLKQPKKPHPTTIRPKKPSKEPTILSIMSHIPSTKKAIELSKTLNIALLDGSGTDGVSVEGYIENARLPPMHDTHVRTVGVQTKPQPFASVNPNPYPFPHKIYFGRIKSAQPISYPNSAPGVPLVYHYQKPVLESTRIGNSMYFPRKLVITPPMSCNRMKGVWWDCLMGRRVRRLA